MKSSAPLAISLTPSRRLWHVQLAAHALAVAALLVATIPLWAQAVLLLGLSVSLYAVHRRYRSPTVACLMLGGDGRLKVGAGGTALREVAVHPHTTVLSFLVVLLYREDGRVRGLSLLADCMDADDFRRLRWRRGAPTPDGEDAAPSPARVVASRENPD